MKRILIIILAACLLWGCAPQMEEPPQIQETTQLQDATQATADSLQPALQGISLGELDCHTLAAMGSDFLLFGADKLTLLSGKELTPVTTVDAPGIPMPGSGQIQINEQGVCYYLEKEKTVVFLGNTLLETGRLYVTQEVEGAACLSADWNKLYYSTSDSIKALDLHTGASQTLRTLTTGQCVITGVLLEGTALRCVSKNDRGAVVYSLISTENGELLAQTPELETIQTAGDSFFFSRQMGAVTASVFGSIERPEPKCLYTTQEQVFPLLEKEALICASRTEEGLRLEYMPLSFGKITASVTVENAKHIQSICFARDSVWLLDANMLYRWQPEKSPASSDSLYAVDFTNRENPDREGLAALEETVVQLESTWGINILWQEESGDVIPYEGYRYDTEFIPQVYEKSLQILHKVLETFPKDFFKKATKWTKHPLQLVLVRGIYGEPEQGTLLSAPNIQYQLGGKSYLAISLWDEVDRAFYHGVSHLIETRILSTSTAYYEWNTLNPQDFQYDNDYIANQDREDTLYLEAGNAYFIDLYAMSFATEDRARIFEYACMPGNESYFVSPVLQEKLRRICKGIRKTFQLEEEAYLWEQYLDQK